MAPEQHTGDPSLLSEATDVYGLGGVLYFLLFGEPPHAGDRPLPPFEPAAPKPGDAAIGVVSVATSGVDRAECRVLLRVCRHALERRIEGRYATATDFADELSRIQSWQNATRRRRRGFAALIGLGLLFTAAAAFPSLVSEPPQGTASPLRLSVRLHAGLRYIPWPNCGPLHSGDRIEAAIETPLPTATGLYVATAHRHVFPCLPLAGVTDDRVLFPDDQQGWQVDVMSPWSLVIAGLGRDGRRPREADLMEALRTVELRIPFDCNALELCDPLSNPELHRQAEIDLAASVDREGVAAVRRLLEVLDVAFEQYHVLTLEAAPPESVPGRAITSAVP